MLVMRRRRQSLRIVTRLLAGEYNYRSLVQVCGEHLAEFGLLPDFFAVLGLDRSSASFLRLLDQDVQDTLQTLLVPQYELYVRRVDLVAPYAQHDTQQLPYMHRWSRL